MKECPLDSLRGIKPFREDDEKTIDAITRCFLHLYEMAEEIGDNDNIPALQYYIRSLSDRIQYWLLWNREDILRSKEIYEKKLSDSTSNPRERAALRFNEAGVDINKVAAIYVEFTPWRDAFQFIIDDSMMMMNMKGVERNGAHIAHRLSLVASNLRAQLEKKMKNEFIIEIEEAKKKKSSRKKTARKKVVKEIGYDKNP